MEWESLGTPVVEYSRGLGLGLSHGLVLGLKCSSLGQSRGISNWSGSWGSGFDSIPV